MINLFSHYIPGRSLVLAALEAAVLLVAAQVGISLELADSRAAISGSGAAVLSQACAFALGMIIIMSSMGLYQTDLWNNSVSVSLRVVTAFAVGFGLVAYLVPTLFPGLVALGATTLVLALVGSLCVRAAFHKWQSLGAFRPRVLVLGTGSRVTRLAEYAQRNSNHQVIGYVPMQRGKHYVPSALVMSMAPGDSLLSIAEKHAWTRSWSGCGTGGAADSRCRSCSSARRKESRSSSCRPSSSASTGR
jgi:FlaA1/EpsC-like NDP-sugar epimerase